MSYGSESTFPSSTKLTHLLELIELLGYKKWEGIRKASDQIGLYYWYDQTEYRSWSAIQLSIYRRDGVITVHTRTNAARSHWDLLHQNKTLRTLRDLCGGAFSTDAGRNRFWHNTGPSPSPVCSGCFLARSRFGSSLDKIRIYRMSRKLNGNLARTEPSGIDYLDQMNPLLLSNNLNIPFLIAIWEEYFRAVFTAALKYSDKREAALKKAKLLHTQLELIATERQQLERSVAESFNFQRPSSISENFKMLDSKLDLGAVFRKPYKSRKVSLYDSIERLVESRNAFVHSGEINREMYDTKLNRVIEDIAHAVDRSYTAIGAHFGFEPIREY